nr:PREDICTED: uncharacterized protein LOC103552743 isoform X2 [Equus przewalskii]
MVCHISENLSHCQAPGCMESNPFISLGQHLRLRQEDLPNYCFRCTSSHHPHSQSFLFFHGQALPEPQFPCRSGILTLIPSDLSNTNNSLCAGLAAQHISQRPHQSRRKSIQLEDTEVIAEGNPQSMHPGYTDMCHHSENQIPGSTVSSYHHHHYWLIELSISWNRETYCQTDS